MPIQQKSLTLNRYGIPVHSNLASGTTYDPAVYFDQTTEIQQRFVRTSNVNIKNFVQHSNIAVASFSLGSGQQYEFSTTLTPEIPHTAEPNFAIGYISLYQQTGTVTFLGTAQIFPRVGNGVAIGAYTCQAFSDFHRYDGTQSVISGAITNNGGSQSLIFVSYWTWIQYNSGSNP